MKPFDFGTLERTRTTNNRKHTQETRNKERQIRTKQNNNLTKEEILNTRIALPPIKGKTGSHI